MFKSFKTHMSVICSRPGFMLTFMGLLAWAFYILVCNVMKYKGTDISNMINPVELMILGEGGKFHWYFVQFYPFLAVIPAAFSIMTDSITGELPNIIYRSGTARYYISKQLAVFAATFICFAVPFIIEMAANFIVFPKEAMGNLYGCDLYSSNYESIFQYPFIYFYANNRVVFQLIYIGITSSLAGLLAVFASSVSVFLKRFRAIVFIPVYLILAVAGRIGNVFDDMEIRVKFQYGNYITSCSTGFNQGNYIYLLAAAAILLALSIGFTVSKIKRDCI